MVADREGEGARTGHTLSAGAAARRVLEAAEREEGIVVVLVLDGPAKGRRRVVTERGGEGDLGDDELAREVDRIGAGFLSGEQKLRKNRSAGSIEVKLRGAAVRLYLERTLPAPELVIVGAGHLARPLTRLGALLGHRVSVLDDRPDFVAAEHFPDADRVLRVSFQEPFADVAIGARTRVLLVTRGHRYDYECLRRLLSLPAPPAYIGMIGSRRRVRATFHQLREEGFSSEVMARIRAPVGLDVGAETPEEIAVAVAAELVLFDRGGTGKPLTEVERIAERFFPSAPEEGGAAEPSEDETTREGG